ncbi:hypothetical protein [Bradyrhizobium sp. 190]|nr:hypothetical protein [Bradyrhizobium sp. 190]
MKYAAPHPFVDPEKAARKLLEIANQTIRRPERPHHHGFVNV